MIEFIRDVARYEFLRFAVIAAALASVACGAMGSYVVVRRSTYVAGAVAHAILGGIGAARYFQVVWGWDWLTPMTGALGAALLAAFVMGAVTLFARQREDTVLSAIWAIGMAVGVSFITATPGYVEDLRSYLFGNILMVRERDVWLMAALVVVVVVVTGLFHNKFLAICFQEEMARLRGLPVGLYHMLLLVLTALTIVMLVSVVGVVLAIALLALPAATAGLFSRRLWQMMALATALCLFFTLGGLALSYGPELPAGATIVEVAGAAYLLALLSKKFGAAAWRRMARSSRDGN